MSRIIFVAALLFAANLSSEEPPNAPWLERLEPFGAAQGETVEVRLVGARLADLAQVRFDTNRIGWIETLSVEPQAIVGRVRVNPDAALGAHTIHLDTANGRSNSRLFYVDGLPSRSEAEPNDTLDAAQQIELVPQVLHGGLPKMPDRDYYRFKARAGERWVFDVRSIEYGGFLESELELLDANGHPVAFNDDRDDYLETPTLEHTFAAPGTHYLRVDQYRGPQRVNCNKNCGYMLRISQSPVLEAALPLGARRGYRTRIVARGRGLAKTTAARIVPARNAEHYRLTFPHTIPVRAAAEPPPDTQVEATIIDRSDSELTMELEVPAEAPLGLWRLWLSSPAGPADGLALLVDDRRALTESAAMQEPLAISNLAIDASLDEPDEEDVYALRVRAGQPLRISVLAVQLGLPHIDPVLELFDSGGKLIAEHDDLMSGQGTVIGNPDASLHHTPPADGVVRVHVRDRIGRGGPSYVYRLLVDDETPGFRMITDTENPAVPLGGKSRIGVLLIRDPGFEQAVQVWAEDIPPGLEVGVAEFRADQFFGPSGDGDNVVIPEVFLDVSCDSAVAVGQRDLRILGRAEDGRVVEAFATLRIGPPGKRNDVRRPLPGIVLSIVGPQ